MKKYVCLILSLLMVVSCFAGCNSAENPETTAAPKKEHVLKVGYGRADISPTESVPLSGYDDSSGRMSTEVSDPIYATCIAFTDENDTTVLLFHMDLGSSLLEVMLPARVAIAKATGIPKENIFTAATHMHSGPDMKNTEEESIVRYNKVLQEKMLQAAKDALADRKVAKMYTATAYPEKLNFIRHYILADGTKTGWERVSRGNELLGHTSDPDNALQMVKFVREGGKDVVMVNWQSHPHRGGGQKKTNVTSDIVGSMRDVIEKTWDCQFAYFTGASGDVNPKSMITAENITKDYIQQGQALAQYALDAADQFKEAKTGAISVSSETCQVNGKNGGYGEVPISAFTIGDLGFASAPYEMFNENGMAIKEGSPFPMTFVVTCCNGRYLYIPAAPAYEYDTYEVSVTTFAAGTGEQLAQTYVSMLKKLYDAKEG